MTDPVDNLLSQPVTILNSFLAQAKAAHMAVVVFAGFVENNAARFISKHTLNEGTEKAFLGKFLATDEHAVDAAAIAIAKSFGGILGKMGPPLGGDFVWSDLSDDQKERLQAAARAAIEAARSPERSKIIGPGGKVPS